MGAQLTKEQASLPFGYVSIKSVRRSRITGLKPSSTIRPNGHLSSDTPETLLNDFFELNSHLQNSSSHLTSIISHNVGETGSINTTATDVIVPEVTVVDTDKSPEEQEDNEIYTPHISHAEGDGRVCCHIASSVFDDDHHPHHRETLTGLSAIQFSELPSLTNIGLCQLGLVKLSPNICFLLSTTSLQICCNELTNIPPEIGHMKNLTALDVSENRLQTIPDTIGFLHKLVELKLSKNQLISIPSSIGSMKKLGTLYLDHNRITELPSEIGQIKDLVNLDVSHNPLTVLPAEIGRLQYLRKLRIDDCPLQPGFVHELAHSPPSLMELAARTIVRQQIPILQDTTQDIKNYLASAKKCSFCAGPYFENFVKRGKIIEKNDHPIPLEYRLCCPHWNTEQERVSLLFCALPDTAPSAQPYKHPRHTSPSNVSSKSSHRAKALDINDTSSDPHSKMQRRASTRSVTIPISSLTKSPSLPNLPLMTSPQRTSDRPQQEEKAPNKKNSTSKRGSLSLWPSRKNSAASGILAKPSRNSSTVSRLYLLRPPSLSYQTLNFFYVVPVFSLLP
ncbi:hypothetical protein G9A89_000953 [Geosiphon pyriformis]|nr:hypothetical protein G9A89_000953 [Geosiphon pyriformis]